MKEDSRSRSAALLAPSAFLASDEGTKDFQSKILQFTTEEDDPWIAHTEQGWIDRYSVAEPLTEVAHLQRSWDRASIKQASEIIVENASTDRDRARLIAVASLDSGDWLHALPVCSCGLRLDDEAIRVAIGLRLGRPFVPSTPATVAHGSTALVTHVLSCRLGTGRLARHQQLNDSVCRALERASIVSKQRVNEISCGTANCAQTVLPSSLREGLKCLTWVVTVAVTFVSTYESAMPVRHCGSILLQDWLLTFGTYMRK